MVPSSREAGSAPQVMTAVTEAANSEEKQLPDKTETMISKPRKECLLENIPNVPDGKSEESESASTSPNEGDVSGSPVDGWYNIYADLDVWDSEVSNISESPGQQDAYEYEVEDWDKELEESTCGPYDADDLSCGSFEENNPFGSYVWKEDWFYNPGCHHTPCFVFPPRVRTVEKGQFDDADE